MNDGTASGKAPAGRRSLLGGLVAAGLFMAAAVVEGATNRIDVLTAELARTREDMEQARKAADEANKRFFRFNHDVVYTNAQAKAIYEEIVELERKTVEKRRQLNEMLMTTPEMKAIKEERRAAYERLSRLKDREQLLLNDIRAEGLKIAGQGGGRPAADKH
ncbi:MAG: hypothetical protein FJ225_02790 [Lentisphaerae bacterium]|nr:hypothetical protein [Lentisphaerota bacterium]